MLLAKLLATPAPAADEPAAPAPQAANVCPSGTKLVEGMHWDTVQRLCTTYKQGHCYAFVPGMLAFESIATPVRTCMDELEWPNQAGKKPEVMMRFVEAEEKCASVGKRLCTEYEWELACEGPETRPYPYGYTYDATACNTDKEFVPYNEEKLNAEERKVRDAETRRVWQGEPSGSRPRCASYFGVKDLVGNVEEWVGTSRKEWRYRSSLKGGYWAKPWAHCRGTNDSHGPMFRYYEIGFRCCAEPSDAVTAKATTPPPSPSTPP
jgi:formylglycine-generating enzyme required for sulfatase activity